MKRHTFLLVLLYALSVSAAERVSLEQLQSDWTKYVNQTVVISTPLVVCGNFYDSLVLAPERLVCPEERAVGLADGDSTRYYELAAHNYRSSICVHCRNNYYSVRTGDKVHGLKARVTAERQLVTGQSVKTRHAAKSRLPKKNKGEMRIVGANIENYFAVLGGYAHRKTTPAQQALQTRKLAKGLQRMKADLFAMCEMQKGDKAPKMLLEELNKHGDKYAYVDMGWSNQDRISGCFIYRKDRIRPVGPWFSAYQDTTSHYHVRMVTQCFEEIATGERFVISLNHLKSKRKGKVDTNTQRMQNTDSLLVMLPKALAVYGDEDVLLLGDYNCYTQEQPIQTIVRAGYADMLQVYCADDYSYSYHGEVGYLDRCFANPTMQTQIVRVMPWHINADWYYSHEASKMRDKTYHRYSDHDPIIVDVRLKKATL